MVLMQNSARPVQQAASHLLGKGSALPRAPLLPSPATPELVPVHHPAGLGYAASVPSAGTTAESGEAKQERAAWRFPDARVTSVLLRSAFTHTAGRSGQL